MKNAMLYVLVVVLTLVSQVVLLSQRLMFLKLSEMYRIFLVVMFVCCYCISFSQSVDPLTGRAIINIPIGSVSAVDLSVSVNLSHHGGALKVNEGPGNAGMGWNVNMGGYISREVRGLPDDYNVAGDSRKGWLFNSNAQHIQNFTPSADDNLHTCTDEAADWNFISGLQYLRDPEPDVFYFNVPGYSGKFVFGADGLPKIIPYQDLQILFTGGVFTIKSNSGIVYTFGAPVQVTRQSFQFRSYRPVRYFLNDYFYYQAPVDFVSVWNLTQVASTASGTAVNYNYTQGRHSNSAYFKTAFPGDTLYYIKDIVKPALLSQISLKNYAINISWANQLVDKIVIIESETGDSKEFDFIYRSIASTSDNIFPKIGKPFLMEIKQQNSAECAALPSYLFEYAAIDTALNRANISWRTGWGEDFFGYYNGQDQNQNIPTLYFYGSENGARRYRVTPIPGLTPTRVIQGYNRNVNPAYATFGAIQKIHYPTGGVTAIAYESNTYFDASTAEELSGPGVRVASITASGGETPYGKTSSTHNPWHSVTKSYQYAAPGSTITSGKIIYPPVFAFTEGDTIFTSQSDLGPGSEVLYSRITEIIPGQGYRVYEYDVPNVYPDATSAATVSKLARPSGACRIGLLRNGSYMWPYAPLTDLNFMRGYLTRVSEFSEANILTQRKRMVYSTPQSNTVLKGLRFEGINDDLSNKMIYYYSLYEIPVEQSRLLTKEVVKIIDNGTEADSIITTYQYNAKNMLVQTTEAHTDNSVIDQYIRYALDYPVTSPAAGDVQANAIYKLNNSNRYSEVIEIYQSVTGIKLNVFKDYGTYVWPYQVKHFPPVLSFTPASVTAGASQSFQSSSQYITDVTLDYANGLAVNQVGTLLIPTGIHYSSGTGLPLATFVNCKAENAVYEGFDLQSEKGLTPTNGATPTTPQGWTGKKSILLNNTFKLVSASAITKTGNSYRISCWAYAGSPNTTITVNAKNGGTIQSTLTLSLPVANQWRYLEGFMNMSSVSTVFTLEVESGGNVQIDDFLALPKTASVSLKTHQPLTGLTSETDDRGYSTVVSYDLFGRKESTYDRKRNLVEKQEYGLQRPGKVTLNANFTANASEYVVGRNITFTAPWTCIGAVNYQWTFTDFNGVQSTATGGSVVKIFNSYGAHSVTLTVSAPGHTTVSYTDNICVILPASLNIMLGVSPSTTIYECDHVNSRSRTFTATLRNVPAANMPVSYTWLITDNNGNWVNAVNWTINNGGVTLSGNTLTYASPPYSYQVKCFITVGGESVAPGNPACNMQYLHGDSGTGITFVNQSQCQ
jgi:hypothetical protein